MGLKLRPKQRDLSINQRDRTLELEIRGEIGSLCEGSDLRGLWFAHSDHAHNASKIMACITMLGVVRGLETSPDDYDAAMTGRCEVKPGPPQVGGFILYFPSSRGV